MGPEDNQGGWVDSGRDPMVIGLVDVNEGTMRTALPRRLGGGGSYQFS